MDIKQSLSYRYDTYEKLSKYNKCYRFIFKKKIQRELEEQERLYQEKLAEKLRQEDLERKRRIKEILNKPKIKR